MGLSFDEFSFLSIHTDVVSNSSEITLVHEKCFISIPCHPIKA